ncbi:Spacial regulator of FtsZ polymerization, MipZ [hydrothermal vent metagenome]|uniref:Spacial regulator of FtsZ polymerization, MipZ n=1 Tax=hydrothermal vent metagenome TaxID=652676 RepID=A0A3B0TBW9_9ZZZZ
MAKTTSKAAKTHIIVVGNEKGGSGKSTSAMHIVVSLLERDYRVAIIDLDARQKSLARYIENRRSYADQHGLNLKMPEIHVLQRSDGDILQEVEQQDRDSFSALLDELKGKSDYIVIDCPGSDTFLSRLAHISADTLITPVNDSFVDVDLLAKVNPDTFQVEKLSLYSEMVWEARKMRAMKDRGTIDWVVLRNRTSALDAKNKRRVHDVLTQLQKRVAFRYVPGFGERVIYRELFPKGLTLVDFRNNSNEKMTLSHVAARQEIRRLMDDLNLPGWQENTAAVTAAE